MKPQVYKHSPHPTPSALRRASLPGILHLATDLNQTPEAREIVDLAVQTNRKGWRGFIASSGGPLVIEAERAAVRHTRTTLGRKNIFCKWRARLQTEALIQRERPVLIHAHGYETCSAALGLSQTRHLPVLVDLKEPGEVTPRRKKILQALASRGARFRVPSAYMAKHLREDLSLTTDYLYVVPPGIDLQWYDAGRVSPERLQTLAQLWRLPELSTMILMAMPLAPGFGQRELLESIANLKRENVFTVLVGSDKAAPGTRERIEDLIRKKGLEGKVVMPETCPDWPAACWLASIVVATNTLPRGQAMELLAAQSIGRPVIVTDVGANAEMVKSGETAWVIPPENAASLEAALTEALSIAPEQSIDLAQRTRAFVAENFPQKLWIESTIEIYDAMLAYPMQGTP